MFTAKFRPLIAALLVTTVGSTAYANVISLSAVSQASAPGDDVTVDIYMEFFNATVGGAFDVFYDANLLSLVSFEFDNVFLADIADPDFAILPDNCIADGADAGGCNVGDAELNGIGFGNFDGISGVHRVGTLTFTALDTGVAIIMMATNDVPWEGFFSAVDGSELVVIYGPAKIHIIPLPASAWLFLGSIGLMVGMLRRRRP